MSGFVCSVCGARHEDMPLCFIAPMPAMAAGVPDEERDRRVALSSDQCVVDGEHFFILGNLDIPILGRDDAFRWSLWSSLSKTNFERASELWETVGRETEPPYFGWLSTALPGYPDTLSLKLRVRTQPVGVRPLIDVLEQDHPLYPDQSEGISWKRACELSHAATA
jgi:hypothetical protein